MTIAKPKPRGLMLVFYLLPLTPVVCAENVLHWEVNPETLGKA